MASPVMLGLDLPTTAPPAGELPFVCPEDVRRGVYLGDAVNGRLYCVVDLRRILRKGQWVRLAMLENVVTDDMEPWEFGRLAGLRLVPYERDD